jgi:FkbM family methyltransferase
MPDQFVYRRNKLHTVFEIIRRIENWPTAIGLRVFRRRSGLRLLAFRNGLNVICRSGTRDWDVIHELLFADSYRHALNFLRDRTDAPLVLDLGGNIGLFSLLAALTNKNANIITYEPGPPNRRLLELNLLANSKLSEQIQLRTQAAGGLSRTTDWFFDEYNPGGSGLFGNEGQRFAVQIQPLADIASSLGKSITLLKMDIEGGEYEILAHTPPDVWRQVHAISLELHNDPEGKVSQTEFLRRMESYGYQVETEAVCSYFLRRKAV